MRYFRSYPWGMQLLLFLMMIVTMIGFASFMSLKLLPALTGIDLMQLEVINEKSPASLVRVAIIVQAITSLFIFLIPAYVFAYLAHPKPNFYLGLRSPGKGIQILLVVLVMLGATPVLQSLEALISLIDFGANVKKAQAINDGMMNAFLNMPDFGAFVKVFIVMAVIPAVGEEMFFRGIMLRFVRKKTSSMVVPILFTAAIFAYMHSNIYGYLSIFLAGILLAVIYNITGSLWCSIIAHLFFNGLQIVLTYLGNSNAALKKLMEGNTIPVYLVAGGAILFCVSFYLLLKTKTPLPRDWADDFTPDELSSADTGGMI